MAYLLLGRPAFLATPTELKNMILGHVDVADLARVRLVNKEFNDIVTSQLPFIFSDMTKNHKNRLQRALDRLDFAKHTLLTAVLKFDDHFSLRSAERDQKSAGLQVFAKWYYSQNKHRGIFTRCKHEGACMEVEAHGAEAPCVEEKKACNELARLTLFVLQQIYPSDANRTKMDAGRMRRIQDQLVSKLKASSALYDFSNARTASEIETVGRQFTEQLAMLPSRDQTTACWRQTYHMRNVLRLNRWETERLGDLLPSLPGHRHLQYCILPNHINTALLEKLCEGIVLSGKEKAVLMGDIRLVAVEGTMSMRWGMWLGENGAALRYCL
ncbi:hypothetical protein LTR97_007488 [Elasticomyces elasticus]|uniref:F-box domain-containing protein n=1 Tax=Elasticomyces elasticus TaxID=574655 RepID=A0AAN7W509_9PEZI|nr:hypothetical protein LTR97_007488 [Elasticomyces elasticus]